VSDRFPTKSDLDISQARRFLDALGGPGAKFAFRTFDDRGDDPRLAATFHGDLASMAQLSGKKRGQLFRTVSRLAWAQARGAGVFVTINAADGQGAKAENIIGVRALVADADDAGQVASLHQFIRTTGLTPSILVESGGLAIAPDGTVVPKLQAFWRINGCLVAEFTRVQEMLNTRTGCDPSIKDLPRVLRLPGFFHMKREPRMTRIVEQNHVRYEYRDILRRVEAAPTMAAVPQGSHRRHGAAASGTGQTASPAVRDRLRALVDRYDGRIRPAVATLIAEARGPSEAGGGNRHHTLITAVGFLVHFGWNDIAIHAAVTLEANRLWGGHDRRGRVQAMIDHARGRERAQMPATSPRMAAFVRALGGGRV
jgi:hypothetical protein